MRFTKMHGIGNDYVYVNGFSETVEEPASVAMQVSDRHFGIGGDGLILILPSARADVRMRMFNADGSESEMCGNGVRCVAKYAYDHGLTKNNPLTVETGRGVLSLAMQISKGKVDQITVDMGEPILHLPDIPVDPHLVKSGYAPEEYLLSADLNEKPIPMYFVSVGNPHAVIFVPDVSVIDVYRLGPLIERHRAFPRRINVHWVQVHSPTEATMRTWERGSGVTMACGTGACAIAVAGVLASKTGRKLTAHLPGGNLQLEWRGGDNHVYMTGPAAEVFSGDWNPDDRADRVLNV